MEEHRAFVDLVLLESTWKFRWSVLSAESWWICGSYPEIRKDGTREYRPYQDIGYAGPGMEMSAHEYASSQSLALWSVCVKAIFKWESILTQAMKYWLQSCSPMAISAWTRPCSSMAIPCRYLTGTGYMRMPEICRQPCAKRRSVHLYDNQFWKPSLWGNRTISFC